MTTRSDKLPFVLLLVFTAALIWSGWSPRDRFTWILEVIPAIVAAAVLIPTYRRFPLTTLAYVLILIHALILMIGGHYTYAEVPLFNWLRDAWGLSRNHYDRLGHLAQGFVPAIVAREVLLRTSPLRPGKWLFCIVICVCMAISAVYEIIEWLVAISTGDSAVSFLALQGDVWDTQEDMALAFIGAVAALTLLGRLHDRQLRHLDKPPPNADKTRA